MAALLSMDNQHREEECILIGWWSLPLSVPPIFSIFLFLFFLLSLFILFPNVMHFPLLLLFLIPLALKHSPTLLILPRSQTEEATTSSFAFSSSPQPPAHTTAVEQCV